MEGGEHVIPSAAASPPGDVTDSAEIHSLISNEQHHHDHDHTAETLDDLNLKIIKQVEYYFSHENLPIDNYLLGFVKRNEEGFVPISVIASFRKMKKLTRDYSIIVAALKESSLLVVSGDGMMVKQLNPQIQFRDHKLYTVFVENLPEDHSKENIHRIFSEAGDIKKISIYDPMGVLPGLTSKRPTTTVGSKLRNPSCSIEKSQFLIHLEKKQKLRFHYGLTKREKLISSKLHALVEYETIEAAEKAVAILNDEQDWRNGMHVKLLKRMGKHGNNKQTCKASNAEKKSSSHVSEQSGDEGNHSSNEHHENTQDEEDGEHLPKDKGGHRYRNQGRSRKHKYHAINGMGHGSTSSTHAAEASKPPPGPRMPDGTRGFAIGRGRPPVPAPN